MAELWGVEDDVLYLDLHGDYTMHMYIEFIDLCSSILCVLFKAVGKIKRTSSTFIK